MAERHESLPELPEIDHRTTKRPKDEDDAFLLDEGVQFPKSVDPVNQWRLLKVIKAKGVNGYALSDLRWLFQVDDPQSPLLQKPLQQLLKARRIRKYIGVGKRTECVGVCYAAIGSASIPDEDSGA